MLLCLLALALASALAGCSRDPAPGGGRDGGPLDAAAAAPPSGPPAPTVPIPEPVTLLRWSLTSGVKNKEPVDTLDHAEPGQRVWAHLAVRNRSGRTRRVTVVFRVGDSERTRVDLDVEASWSFRTWAYVTLQARDTKGQVTAVVLDDAGAVLGERSVDIRK